MSRLPILLVLVLLAPLVSGCAGVVIGAGASAGVAASEERGLEGAIDDAKIRAEINHLWFQKDIEMYRQVTLNITEGRVLLTGTVVNADARIDAVRLCWQVAGVREVINEIRVGDGGGFNSFARDLEISLSLKQRLLFDKQVRNINYTTDVNEGVVYLMGLAQDERELDRVIAHAREISGVKGVVSHVRLKTDPRRVGG